MTDTQLYLSIGIPMLFNAALIGLLVAYINARFDGVTQEVKGPHEDSHEIREDIREIRSDVKLLTGKVYEMMGQKRSIARSCKRRGHNPPASIWGQAIGRQAAAARTKNRRKNWKAWKSGPSSARRK